MLPVLTLALIAVLQLRVQNFTPVKLLMVKVVMVVRLKEEFLYSMIE